MKLYDIPRLYTAMAESMAVIYGVVTLERKVTGVRFVLISLLFTVLQSAFMILTADVPLFMWLPCMALAVCFMISFYRITTTLDLTSSVYYTMFSFVCAEFMASLEQLPDYYLLRSFGPYSLQRLGLMAAVYTAAISPSL